MIKLSKIRFGYTDEMVIDNVTRNFSKGMIYGIVGKNGVGKSTLLDLIASKLYPNEGQITIDNIDITKVSYIENPAAVINNEKIFYKNLTVREHFGLLKLYEKNLDIEHVLEEFNLVSYADNLPSELSLGTAQRFNIALKSVKNLDVILADEPFNGLDPLEVERLKSFFADLKQKGCTMLISSHDIHALETLCDEILILKDGQLFETEINVTESKIHERI